MSGRHPSSNKRQREDERARRAQEKSRRRQEKRALGPREIPVVSAQELMRGLPTVEEAMRAIDQRAHMVRQADTIPARLFVGSLSPETKTEQLRAAFAAIGPVADAIVMVDRDTRAPRGFGFVTMADRRDAAKAISALHGSELCGSNIVVNIATESPARRP